MVTLVISGIQRECPSALVSAAIGTTGALAILTRMDSFVIVAPLIALYAWSILRAYGSSRVPAFALAVGVPLVICGGWLAWKFVYYGSLLPNTYRAKVEGLGGLTREGMRFVRTFVQAYAFYLPLACVPIGGWLAWEGRLDRRVMVVVTMPLALWIAYVVRVGGDFMEYRLLVPALPLVFLATYWVMCELDAKPARAALLTSIVLAGGMWSYRSTHVPMPAGSPLPLHDIALRHEWFEIGTVLRDAFAHSIQPKIAVVPAGVIPYQSRLPSVDMLGLNDPGVRDFLYLRDHVIGHRRLAPLDLLERRRVHFLIAHPVVRARLAPTMRYRFADFAQRPFAYVDEYRLKGRRVIELPLSGSRVMLMVYLTEDSAVTARIDQIGWRHYPLD
jgi:arabinofuranosyltransferase